MGEPRFVHAYRFIPKVRGPLVLVAGGDAGRSAELKAGLIAAGFRAETAEGGRETILRLRLHAPAVLFLDVKMPDWKDTASFREVQALMRTLPVVVMAEPGDADLARQLLNLGAVDFLIHPIETAQAVRMIRWHLSRGSRKGPPLGVRSVVLEGPGAGTAAPGNAFPWGTVVALGAVFCALVGGLIAGGSGFGARVEAPLAARAAPAQRAAVRRAPASPASTPRAPIEETPSALVDERSPYQLLPPPLPEADPGFFPSLDKTGLPGPLPAPFLPDPSR